MAEDTFMQARKDCLKRRRMRRIPRSKPRPRRRRPRQGSVPLSTVRGKPVNLWPGEAFMQARKACLKQLAEELAEARAKKAAAGIVPLSTVRGKPTPPHLIDETACHWPGEAFMQARKACLRQLAEEHAAARANKPKKQKHVTKAAMALRMEAVRSHRSPSQSRANDGRFLGSNAVRLGPFRANIVQTSQQNTTVQDIKPILTPTENKTT